MKPPQSYFVLFVLIVSLLPTMAKNSSCAIAQPSLEENSFFVRPFLLFAPRINVHDKPSFAFDAFGNLHSVDVEEDEEGTQFYSHFWTNLTSNCVMHNRVDLYEYPCLRTEFSLFLSMESRGISWFNVRYNRSSSNDEFIQYDWKPGVSLGTKLILSQSSSGSNYYYVAWNGSHPFFFRWISYYQPELYVLWPGEDTFQSLGSLEGNKLIMSAIEGSGDLILWTQSHIGETQIRLMAWRVIPGLLDCVVNMTMESCYLKIHLDDQGNFWLLNLPYYSSGVSLYCCIFDAANENYNITQECQTSIIPVNYELQLGLSGHRPFIVYLGASPDLESSQPVPLLGYWSSTEEYVSVVLDTKRQNSDAIEFYHPIGSKYGLVIPYYIENVACNRDFDDNNLDRNQRMDGVYLATNLSALGDIKPMIFGLREYHPPDLYAYWPLVVAFATLSAGMGGIGYWYFRKRNKVEKYIDTLGMDIHED